MTWSIKKPLGKKGKAITQDALAGGAILGPVGMVAGGIYGAKTGKGITGPNGIFSAGKKDGPPNPFAPPDPSNLLNVDVQNPYRDEIIGGLDRGKAPSYLDYYRPPTEGGGAAFNAYTKAIGAPSSVDEVTREISGQRYQDTLREIGRGTDLAAGTKVGEFLRRNLVGDGNDSDVARVGVAQVAQQGQEAGARAALDYQGQDLQRLAAKEAELRGAYGKQYQTATATDTQMRELAARAAQGDQQAAIDYEKLKIQTKASLGEEQAKRVYGRSADYMKILSDLYTGGASRQQAGEKGSYVDTLLRNTNVSVNPFALVGA